MANKRVDDSAGIKIRHYVFALMRKHSDNSVKLPSSYELAEMFGTTRRVARYELECLIDQGSLLSKPRIGTFTNPRQCYINITPVQKKMPLIASIDGDGQRFCYGRAENLIYSNIGLSLAKRKCYLHHLRFSCTDDDSRIQELKTLGLDGMIWHLPWNNGFPSQNFLRKVEEGGVPVVAILHQPMEHIPSVVLSIADAENKLCEMFRREKRDKFLVLTNSTMEISIAASIAEKLSIPTEHITTISNTDPFPDKIVQLQELLSSGYRPDVIICDPLFAETLPEIVEVNGIDIIRQCRVVACNELNDEDNFCGCIIAPNPVKTTDAAADLLLEIISHKAENMLKIREVECDLKIIGLSKNAGV